MKRMLSSVAVLAAFGVGPQAGPSAPTCRVSTNFAGDADILGKAKPEAKDKRAEGAKDKPAANPKADKPKLASKAKQAAAE